MSWKSSISPRPCSLETVMHLKRFGKKDRFPWFKRVKPAFPARLARTRETLDYCLVKMMFYGNNVELALIFSTPTQSHLVLSASQEWRLRLSGDKTAGKLPPCWEGSKIRAAHLSHCSSRRILCCASQCHIRTHLQLLCICSETRVL